MQDKLINNCMTPKSTESDNLFETLKADFSAQKSSPDGYETILIGEQNDKGIEKFLAWIPQEYEIFTQQGNLNMGNLNVPVYGIKAQLKKKNKEEAARECLEIVKEWLLTTKRESPWKKSFEVDCKNFTQEMVTKIVSWAKDDMHFFCIHDPKQNLIIIKQLPNSANMASVLYQIARGYDDTVYEREKSDITKRALQNASAGMGHVDLFHSDKKILQYLIEWFQQMGTFTAAPITDTNCGYKSRLIWDNYPPISKDKPLWAK